jgi:hypothetical protein
MLNRFVLSAFSVLLTPLAASAQTQVQRPPAAQKPLPAVSVVACPSSISVTVNPGGGWVGGTQTGKLSNLSPMDGTRMYCIYTFVYVTISKPAAAGQKCAVAPDKKSFICK